MTPKKQSVSVKSLLNTQFSGLITTDIILKNGRHSQMVTLLTDINMFDETVMGISQGLKSGGKAVKWQSRVYSFRDGTLTRPIVYNPHIAH